MQLLSCGSTKTSLPRYLTDMCVYDVKESDISKDLV